ncbi:MAG: 30S ribosomal protein S9 [Bacteroidales bacterium]|nr:30S ribosomal protein S9 [Bacteroidales bacterium]
MQVYNGLGRRKSAVARVYMQEGKGNIIINGRELNNYFASELLHYVVKQPFMVLNLEGQYDVKVTLDGGGQTGQSQAVRMGIARALVEANPEYKSALRAAGFMTRDSRSVERKKPGQPKARKRFQFSKR